MFETYNYNRTVRKIATAFGAIFSGIQVQKRAGTETELVKVPLEYSPRQAYLTRITENPNLTKMLSTTFPRMGFDFTDLAYDFERKHNITNKIYGEVADSGTMQRVEFMRAPYDLTFNLFIVTTRTDDMLEIVEQIAPNFQDEIVLSIRDNDTLGLTTDIIIKHTNTTQDEDAYENTFEEGKTRRIVWNLTFTAKFWLYRPTQDADIMTQVDVNEFTNLSDDNFEDERLTVRVSTEGNIEVLFGGDQR